MRASHARSVSAVTELSGPSTTPMTTSSASRRMVTALPLPLPWPSMTCSMRRNSDSSPWTSVPLPGSMETRASGATSHSSDARSMRPRRPRMLLGRLCRFDSMRIASSSADSVASTPTVSGPPSAPGGGGAWVSAVTPLRRRSAAPWASCVRSQPSSCRVSLPLDTRGKDARSGALFHEGRRSGPSVVQGAETAEENRPRIPALSPRGRAPSQATPGCPRLGSPRSSRLPRWPRRALRPRQAR